MNVEKENTIQGIDRIIEQNWIMARSRQHETTKKKASYINNDIEHLFFKQGFIFLQELYYLCLCNGIPVPEVHSN
jgi:hypothetical protein